MVGRNAAQIENSTACWTAACVEDQPQRVRVT
jgi:hypothetical protein